MLNHQVVSEENWLEARKALLAKEKEFTHLRDELSRQRRELPWVKVEKKYQFDTTGGKQSLGDLFDGRSQLVVYHFMLAPGWTEGCPGCSYLADHFDGAILHLNARDVSFVVVSRAPLSQIEAFKNRMGWNFKWVSSSGSDFNFDYHVSFSKEQLAKGTVQYNFRSKENSKMEEMPGLSAFIKESTGEIFHTYSTYERGLDAFVGAYQFLDVAPKGRNEEGLPSPMSWVRHHDRYQNAHQPYTPPWAAASTCKHCEAEAKS